MFRNANPLNLRGSLFESDKDHLLNQARSDLAKQELHFMPSPSTSASVNYNDKRKSKDWRYKNAQYGFVESRRESVRLQEELSMKEEVLRNTPIRTVHEVGEIERAQEQRTDEVSVQKLRENHETIQQLTSQLQQMQEQMNSMNGSGRSSRCGVEL